MHNRQSAIIPFIILLYFFFHFISDLFYFLDFWKVVSQVIKYFFFTGLLYWIGFKIFQKKDHFTLAFSTMLFFFLFYGVLMKTLVAIGVMKSFEVVTTKLLLSYLAICLLIVVLIFRLSKRKVVNLLRFWMIYCIILIVYDTAYLVFSTKEEKKYLTEKRKEEEIKLEKKPEIFFLLFDMYPSDSALKKYLHYDNSALNSFLKSKDFYVTGDARSLYAETYFSLGSTLDLVPLEYLKDKSIKSYKKNLLALKNVKHSRLLEIFSTSGYDLRNYSVFDLQDQPSPLSFSMKNHLDNILTSSTFFNWMYYSFETDFFKSNNNINLGFLKTGWSTKVKSDVRFQLDEFNKIVDDFSVSHRPAFNYFHFNMPHPPVLYDSAGNELGIRDMYSFYGYERATNNFLNYIKYVNGEIKRMVESILSKIGKNVIIIIQGDHGYREFSNRFSQEMRFSIYNAVYLPDFNYNGFIDTMKPIQTFKKIMDNQFNYRAK